MRSCGALLLLATECFGFHASPTLGASRQHALELRSASPQMMPIGTPKVDTLVQSLCSTTPSSSAVATRHPSHSSAPDRRAISRRIHRAAPIAQVAYRVPGSSVADWVGIYDRLYRERIMFLGQEVDDEIVNKLVAIMLYSDAEDPSKPMYLYLNTPGGSIISGLTLYDTMQHIASPVATVNIGMAASMVSERPGRRRLKLPRALATRSMLAHTSRLATLSALQGSFLLGAGERGKRIALPHSRVMIHQPMGGARGQAEDIRIEAEQILKCGRAATGMAGIALGGAFRGRMRWGGQRRTHRARPMDRNRRGGLRCCQAERGRVSECRQHTLACPSIGKPRPTILISAPPFASGSTRTWWTCTPR